MTPWYVSMLKRLAQAALFYLSGWLTEHNVWTKAEGDSYVNQALPYVVPALIAVGSWIWGHRSDIHARVKLMLTLHWADATEAQVEAHIAKGEPVPSKSTPKDTVPQPVQ